MVVGSVRPNKSSHKQNGANTPSATVWDLSVNNRERPSWDTVSRPELYHETNGDLTGKNGDLVEFNRD